jgi:hypothetical protein
MMKTGIHAILFFYCGILCLFTGALAAVPDTAAPVMSDTAARVISDTAAPVVSDTAVIDTEAQENEFQEDVDGLFPQNEESIDTSGWCTSHINTAQFDYKAMKDTLRMTLVDSLHGKFFAFPFKNYITSPFGPRGGFWHFGVDVKVRVGDTIRCAFDGIIRVIQNDRHGYGKVVVVRHPHRLETLYGHLSKCPLAINQQLKAGDMIGLGGNSGRSTGSHLHFETRFCGEPFDPQTMVDFAGFRLKNDTLALVRDNFDYLTELRKTIRHTIRRGETLGAIARHYSTSVRKLCMLNRISARTILKIGRKIIVRKDNPPDQQ